MSVSNMELHSPQWGLFYTLKLILGCSTEIKVHVCYPVISFCVSGSLFNLYICLKSCFSCTLMWPHSHLLALMLNTSTRFFLHEDCSDFCADLRCHCRSSMRGPPAKLQERECCSGKLLLFRVTET